VYAVLARDWQPPGGLVVTLSVVGLVLATRVWNAQPRPKTATLPTAVPAPSPASDTQSRTGTGG
jgi:OPA family glycerol-3-phosphate transporter-like MFS transporter